MLMLAAPVESRTKLRSANRSVMSSEQSVGKLLLLRRLWFPGQAQTLLLWKISRKLNRPRHFSAWHKILKLFADCWQI